MAKQGNGPPCSISPVNVILSYMLSRRVTTIFKASWPDQQGQTLWPDQQCISLSEWEFVFIWLASQQPMTCSGQRSWGGGGISGPTGQTWGTGVWGRGKSDPFWVGFPRSCSPLEGILWNIGSLEWFMQTHVNSLWCCSHHIMWTLCSVKFWVLNIKTITNMPRLERQVSPIMSLIA